MYVLCLYNMRRNEDSGYILLVSSLTRLYDGRSWRKAGDCCSVSTGVFTLWPTVIHVTCQGDLAVQRHRLVAFAVKFLLAIGFALYIACPHTQSLYLECLLTLIISHHIIIEC